MEFDKSETPLSSEAPKGAELSEREHEILRLVATGASNKQIAQQLVISPNTVKVHLRNIFGKIGVATRTEAALYAIRKGLVHVAPGAVSVVDDVLLPVTVPAASNLEIVGPAAALAPGRAQRRLGFRWLIAALASIIIILLGFLIYWRQIGFPAAAVTPGPTAIPPRWQTMADMPTARSGMAAATYGDQVYAIGGETGISVTAVNERYDPATNKWAVLSPLPTAVTDIQAAVVGGLIYVPGGRLANGRPSSGLVVYDPRQDKWHQATPMPKALSAYALAAFEGHLYVFGGWDGTGYVNSVYEYDPERDTWLAKTAMATARGFAGAAVAGGKLYVVGGTDGQQPLTINAEYAPEDEGAGQSPWGAGASLPSGRAKMGLASQADIIYLVGGESAGNLVAPLEYFPVRNQWLMFEPPPSANWTNLSLVVVASELLAVGGQQAQIPSATNLAYKAIFTIEIPLMK
jgi:DNA-binding CsgD family transcriptional regulator